jgi:hypothetical protein
MRRLKAQDNLARIKASPPANCRKFQRSAKHKVRCVEQKGTTRMKPVLKNQTLGIFDHPAFEDEVPDKASPFWGISLKAKIEHERNANAHK